jgi:hypothetical protein
VVGRRIKGRLFLQVFPKIDGAGNAIAVAGDSAGTFVVIWNNAAGNVEAVTIVPGGGFGPGTPVGAAPSRRLLVPGKAVLWTAAGISTEPV